MQEEEDDEAPAGIVGSQFFGGNKEKVEFYDPVAEAQAAITTDTDGDSLLYNRFQDAAAFRDVTVAALAASLQSQLSAVLRQQEEAAAAVKGDTNTDSSQAEYTYANTVQWETPLQVKNSQPIEELAAALDFYRRVDVAVTSGERLGENTVRLTWELSLAWPAFWEPQMLLTGSSVVTLNDKKEIVRQVDSLDAPDLLSNMIQQALPRFWDLYHIGMSPSAEQSPRQVLKKKSPFTPYQLYRLPARLVLQPTILETGSREDCNAGTIPNHAFSCVIKTMGPQKQRYVPASPLEVQLVPQSTGPLRLRWNIPVSVESMSANSGAQLPLPPADEESDVAALPECNYQWQPRRAVATLPYGGGPQDGAVTELRKRLYEKVTKDGLQPTLDPNGRPIFFFWQNNVKACYTKEGLGMAVYEWRPDFVKANEIGIELETGSMGIERS
jgi:hypothetical protein